MRLDHSVYQFDIFTCHYLVIACSIRRLTGTCLSGSRRTVTSCLWSSSEPDCTVSTPCSGHVTLPSVLLSGPHQEEAPRPGERDRPQRAAGRGRRGGRCCDQTREDQYI